MSSISAPRHRRVRSGPDLQLVKARRVAPWELAVLKQGVGEGFEFRLSIEEQLLSVAFSLSCTRSKII
jgi:hypothetical protein